MARKKKYHHRLDGKIWETQRASTKKRAKELQKHYRKKLGQLSRIRKIPNGYIVYRRG